MLSTNYISTKLEKYKEKNGKRKGKRRGKGKGKGGEDIVGEFRVEGRGSGIVKKN